MNLFGTWNGGTNIYTTCSNSGAVVRTLRTCIPASRSILVLQ